MEKLIYSSVQEAIAYIPCFPAHRMFLSQYQKCLSEQLAVFNVITVLIFIRRQYDV